jgi:hypothetical protein
MSGMQIEVSPFSKESGNVINLIYTAQHNHKKEIKHSHHTSQN